MYLPGGPPKPARPVRIMGQQGPGYMRMVSR